VVVVGAGPHGLAATAHLRGAGLPVRAFGEPMTFWRETMPPGMFLRSSIRASSIDDPERRLSIGDWAKAADRQLRHPIPIRDFIDYGLWFQDQVVPDLDTRTVASIARSDGELCVTLADGEEVMASRVVVAAGLAPFVYIPPVFRDLSPDAVSHMCHAPDLERFSGQSVLVVGGGQSALEGAALLHELGARVEVLVRRSSIHWLPGSVQGDAGSPPAPSPAAARSAKTGFRARHRLYVHEAPTDVGGKYASWLGAAPDVCRLLPPRVRLPFSYDCVKPAGAFWLPDRLRAVSISYGRRIVSAEEQNGRVEVTLDDGERRSADHVLLGTGYRMNVREYPFLAPELARSIDVVEGYPRLRRGLESSVAGLHFTGAPAYWSFGPTMRFVVGTAYTAPAVAQGIRGRRTPAFRWAF
jgi:Pyridine nucleotide-disulphide oxidoreductase